MTNSRPELHGSDLLAPLSEILQLAGSDRDTAAAVLALEGLCLLCQAEVIDLRSVWAVLGDKLKHEVRPLVITRICHLLSLVPDLSVETEEYEVILSFFCFNLESSVCFKDFFFTIRKDTYDIFILFYM